MPLLGTLTAKSPPEEQSIKQRLKSKVPYLGDKESKPPPKQRQSMKKRITKDVKNKTIDYAKANPTEVVECYMQSNNPKRELALRAMGLKGKTKKGKPKEGRQEQPKRKSPLDQFSPCICGGWD